MRGIRSTPLPRAGTRGRGAAPALLFLALWALAGGFPARAEAAPAVPAAAGSLPVPDGFRLDSREELAPGVEHLVLTRARPPLVVHVARVGKGAGTALRTVLSNEAIAGPAPRLERTSSMCLRVGCLLAVNADFFRLDAETPLGAVVSGGRMLSSPNLSHHQLVITRDGRLQAGSLAWTGSLVATDLRGLTIDGVNVERQDDRLVLYTPEFGPGTGTNRFGAEVLLRVVEPAGPLLLGQTALVELTELREGEGDAPIPEGGAVLSGHDRGADLLRGLWSRVQSGAASPRGLLRLEAPGDVVESVGGTPILLREGRRWFADEKGGFVGGLHPRTAVGWDAEGTVLLVTVDGRQPGYSVGMSLADLADLLLGLGATEAINLDGGGSTTFVVRGEVVNRPSDRAVQRGAGSRVALVPSRRDQVLGNVERPVADALALVPETAPGPPTADPLPGPLGLPQPGPAPAAAASPDPGSLQGGLLPPLSGIPEAQRPWGWLVAVAAGVNLAAGLGFGAKALAVSRARA